jgi:glycosyltransferase involved in cell wall biosynthesis
MKVVVNTSPLLDPLTGVGNYIQELIRYFNQLRPQNAYTYYYGLFRKSPAVGNPQIYRIKKMVRSIPFLHYGLRKSKYLLSHLHREVFDVYFEPNFIPLNIKARKTVTTIHDFSFHSHPEWHPKDRIKFFKKTFYKNISRSTRIITDSAFVKGEVRNILNLPGDMITPIPLGVKHEAFRVYDKESLKKCRDRMNLPRHFIFYVGSVEPRKNLKSLLLAYIELPEWIRKECKLVLAGTEGWNNGGLIRMLDTLKEDVIYLKYVNAEELPYLYNLAILFVYPSLYEGFGLPPLEAMACGCPVVVSSAASLPEVCGDAAYYADHRDVYSIAEGMYRVLADEGLRQSLRQKGLQRAKSFSWKKTAEETLAVFDDACNGN